MCYICIPQTQSCLLALSGDGIFKWNNSSVVVSMQHETYVFAVEIVDVRNK